MGIVTAATIKRLVKTMLPSLIAESEELEWKIKDLTAGFQPRGEYAAKKHTHEQAVVPLRKVERGAELAAMLGRKFANEGHTHDEFARELVMLNKRIDNLPAPTAPYDPSPILEMLRALESRFRNLSEQRMEAQIDIMPVAADSITAEADYIVVENCTDSVLVHDATGLEGGTRITSHGKRSIVRAVFDDTPAQPLTFTFISPLPPPTVCSIGTSRAGATI